MVSPLASVFPWKQFVGPGWMLAKPMSPLVVLPKKPLWMNLLFRTASPNSSNTHSPWAWVPPVQGWVVLSG